MATNAYFHIGSSPDKASKAISATPLPHVRFPLAVRGVSTAGAPGGDTHGNLVVWDAGVLWVAGKKTEWRL